MFAGCIYLPDTLSTGHYQLISYTNCMRNSGEQAFFTKEILIANRFDKDLYKIYNTVNSDNKQVMVLVDNHKIKQNEALTISTDRKVYGKRENIKINLEGSGFHDNEVAYLSISVKENLPNANCEKFDFNSANIQNDSNSQPCAYLPEINGIILQGKVTDIDRKLSISKALVYLSTPDSVSNLQFTYTDESGNFKFLLSDYYIDKKIVLNLPNHHKASIELDNKYNLKSQFRPSKYFPDSLIRDFITKSQNIVQIQKTYNTKIRADVLTKPQSCVYPPLVYPPVNDAVFPADFVSLPDFVEISREILPLLKTRKHKGGYESKMLNLTKSQFFDSDPLIFLDGVPVENINSIINLGSDKINKIETVGTERYYGDLYFQGVLSVFTKKMEINNVVRTTPTLTIKYVVLHPPSVLANPELKKQREPDFRQLLYWEPSLTIGGNEAKMIEFRASDNKGEYMVMVEGFTMDGRFISANTTFKVDNSSKK
jgi:hypothetical protein